MDRLSKILLVEDNPGDAMLVTGAIGLFDPAVVVTHVTTLREALAEMGKGQGGMVLLDLNLPDSRGANTFERVLAMAGDVPVVVLTGADDEQLALDAISSGVQDFLVKGAINETTLRRSIRYARERKRLEVELRVANKKLEQLVEVKTEDLERSVAALGEEAFDHQRAEEDLREARERFYDMLDAMPMAFWITSPETRLILYCNTYYAAIAGWNRDLLYKRPWRWCDAIHPDDRNRVEAELEKWLQIARQERSPGIKLRFRVQQPGGKVVWLIARAFAVYAPSGRINCVCGVAEETQPSVAEDTVPLKDGAETS